MESWTVIFYQTLRGEEPVKEFIDKLEIKQQAKIYSHLGLLKQYGLNLPSTYLKKLSGTKKLWELRVGSWRIFLSPVAQKNILLIHMIIKKSNKTPKKDLKLSQNRLQDFLKGGLS